MPLLKHVCMSWKVICFWSIRKIFIFRHVYCLNGTKTSMDGVPYRFLETLKGYRKRTLAWNWLKVQILLTFHIKNHSWQHKESWITNLRPRRQISIHYFNVSIKCTYFRLMVFFIHHRIRKLVVFWCFQGILKKYINPKWVNLFNVRNLTHSWRRFIS